jgi:hypothetical protein
MLRRITLSLAYYSPSDSGRCFPFLDGPYWALLRICGGGNSVSSDRVSRASFALCPAHDRKLSLHQCLPEDAAEAPPFFGVLKPTSIDFNNAAD